MNNPKDKAKELISKFNFDYNSELKEYTINQSVKESKRCSLITVNEILKSVPKQPSISITMPHFEATVYWEQVKTEIENL